jgi:hypothetical protein
MFQNHLQMVRVGPWLVEDAQSAAPPGTGTRSLWIRHDDWQKANEVANTYQGWLP